MRTGLAFWQPKILTMQLMHDNTKDSNIHLHHTHIAKRLEWLSELISEMSEWDVSGRRQNGQRDIDTKQTS